MIDTLTLDQLRVFVTIAESGGFSAASRRLGRAQSAVSHAVRALETAIDVALFDRSGWRPTLTEAGQALLADAKTLLASASDLKSKAAGFAEGIEPELAIAVDPLFPLDRLMSALREVGAAFPAITIRLITDCVGGPERHLRQGTVSIAIYSLAITGSEDLVGRFLTEVEMIPVAASDHPLATRTGPISRRELGDHTQLVLSNGDFGGWSRGVVSDKIWRFADPHTRLEFLLSGFGWCHVAAHEAAEALGDGRLVRLRFQESPSYRLPLHAVHLPRHSLGPVAQSLLARLV